MNAFNAYCQAAAAKSAHWTEQDDAFGITIPTYARDIARGFMAETVAPTANVTMINVITR